MCQVCIQKEIRYSKSKWQYCNLKHQMHPDYPGTARRIHNSKLPSCFMSGGSANRCRQNSALYTQLERQTANQRNEARDTSSTTTCLESPKIHPTQHIWLQLARMVLVKWNMGLAVPDKDKLSLCHMPVGNSVRISIGASGDTKCPCSASFTETLPKPEEKHLVLFFPLLLHRKFCPVLMSIQVTTAIINCFCLNLNQRMITGPVILRQAEMIQIGAPQDGSLRFQT